MDAGQLYGLARDLKAFAEQALGASRGQPDSFTPTHQLVLGEVLAEPGISISELAARLQLAQSGVSTAVATLSERGLLVAEQSDRDRRRVHVHPAAGVARWAKARLTMDAGDVLSPLLAGLGESDRRCVLRALPLLARALQDQRAGVT